MTEKEITNKTIIKFGAICFALVLLLAVPWIPIETEIQCITTPCDPIKENRSPFGLIKDYIDKKRTAIADGEDGGLFQCTLLYSPVCGQNGKTYSNQCFADSAQVKVAYTGECE